MTSMPSAALVPKRPGRELELAFGSTLRACRRCGGSRPGSRGRVKGSIRGRLQAQLTGPFFSLLLCCLQWLLADWPGKTLVSIDYRRTSPCTESMFGHKTVIGRILVMPASASWRQRLGLVSLQGATESLIFSLLCREKRRELGAGFQTARRRPKGLGSTVNKTLTRRGLPVMYYAPWPLCREAPVWPARHWGTPSLLLDVCVAVLSGAHLAQSPVSPRCPNGTSMSLGLAIHREVTRTTHPPDSWRSLGREGGCGLHPNVEVRIQRRDLRLVLGIAMARYNAWAPLPSPPWPRARRLFTAQQLLLSICLKIRSHHEIFHTHNPTPSPLSHWIATNTSYTPATLRSRLT